jgi:hypothetical protein
LIVKANNIKIYNKNKGSVKEPFGFNNAMSYFLKIVIPKMKLTTTITTNTKNINLAMEAAPAAMPEKPNIAAIIAMIKKIAVHLSI